MLLHVQQQDEPGGPLVQGADGALQVAAHDQAPSQWAANCLVVGLGGTLADQHHVTDLPGVVLPTARAALSPPSTQAAGQLTAQFTAGLSYSGSAGAGNVVLAGLALPRDESMRVVSWNVAFRGRVAAQRQGELLSTLSPDLILLQEANPGAADVLRQAAGADWLIRAIDLRAREPDDRPVRSRGVAIAGRGQPPHYAWLPAAVPLPERILAVQMEFRGLSLTAVSYHAPPGASWGLIKPRQAVAFASWLATVTGPVILGADANTPEIDAADFALARTHWHTGDRHLHGEPGDDLLFGPGKIHGLDDALRQWLNGHPAADAAAADRPLGPLAITHRTGKRKDSHGTGRRFDSIWITGQHATGGSQTGMPSAASQVNGGRRARSLPFLAPARTGGPVLSSTRRRTPLRR